MSVAFDAASALRQGFGMSSTHAHTPVVGTPTAVYVLISVNSINNLITGVTYGGVAMTLVGRFVNGGAAQELIYKLESGIPSGTKNVVVTSSNWEDWYVVCFSVTSATPVEVLQTASLNAPGAQTTNPSVVLATASGFDGLVMAIARNSGHTAGSGYTLVTPAASPSATAEYGVKTGANVVADFVTGLNFPYMAAVAVGSPAPTSSKKIKVGGAFVTKPVNVKTSGAFSVKTPKVKTGGTFI